MIRLATELLALSAAIFCITVVPAFLYIAYVSESALIGVNCTSGMIVLRDQEDEFGHCWKIERIPG